MEEEIMKVLLAVTTLNYEKKCVDSLLQLADSKIFYGWVIPDCCLLPFARNKAVYMARENCPDYTHILFVDDDMCGFGPQHAAKLIENTVKIPECDICSALVTMRNPPYKIVAQFTRYNDKDVMNAIKNREIVETTHLGMAFTIIKREVFDAIEEETEEGPIWFTMDRGPRVNYDAEYTDYRAELIKQIDSETITINEALNKAAAFGEQAHRGARLVGEDIEFCRKVHLMGFKTWVDCGVPVGHIGSVGFDFRHAFAENSKNNVVGSGLSVS